MRGVYHPHAKVRWRLWAPYTVRVDVALIDGDTRITHLMSSEARGYFSFDKEETFSGQRYVSGAPSPTL
jgi:1,4-alpha-glucan branching enzyme